MKRNQNRNRDNYSGQQNNSLGNGRTYRTGNYTINRDSYDDGYDDNYPSPSNYMNAGSMNAGKHNRFEDNIFRPDKISAGE